MIVSVHELELDQVHKVWYMQYYRNYCGSQGIWDARYLIISVYRYQVCICSMHLLSAFDFDMLIIDVEASINEIAPVLQHSTQRWL